MPEDPKTPILNEDQNLENGKKAIPGNLKNEGKKGGPLGWIFTKESQLGRFNRNLVRSLGWVVVFFSLGFIAVYYLLYFPMVTEYGQVSQAYNSSQIQLKTAQAENQATQVTKLQNQSNLKSSPLPKDIMDINNQIIQLELSLAKRDPQEAADVLQRLNTSFEIFLPEVTQTDPNLADRLEARLKLVNGEISNDPANARTDLEVMVNSMQDLINKIAQ